MLQFISSQFYPTVQLEQKVIKIDPLSGFAEFPEPGDEKKRLLPALIDYEFENTLKTMFEAQRAEKDGKGINNKDLWMPDKLCKVCYMCEEIFTMYRRRHHCRLCGQIFCHNCSSYSVDGALVGLEGLVRSCKICHDQIYDISTKEANMLSRRLSNLPVSTPDENTTRQPISRSKMSFGTNEIVTRKLLHISNLQRR